eukprot:7583962-Alexandrium_andersonii.AAC.1
MFEATATTMCKSITDARDGQRPARNPPKSIQIFSQAELPQASRGSFEGWSGSGKTSAAPSA